MIADRPLDLYHFTCEHGHSGMGTLGVVRPNWQPTIGATVSWFTDLADPTRDDLGLTSESGLINCDRMTYRYRVVDDEAHLKLRHWLGSGEQARTDPHVQMILHSFGQPKHWWVASREVLVELVTP